MLGPGLPIEEAVRRRLKSKASALVGEVGRSSRRAGAVPLRPDLPVGDWTALSACCFRSLGRPMSCVLPAWAEPWRGSRSPRDPGFMNLAHVVGQFISECPPLVLSGVSPLRRKLLLMRSIFLINHFCA